MPLAVGIDLGTTNSCVAIYQNGHAHIIDNEFHDKITPSFVYYGDEIVVGKDAQERSAIKPQNGIFDTKRLIGRKYDDPEIKDYRTRWPFSVVKAHQEEPVIQLEQKETILLLRPEEVSAQILRQLREDACRGTGEDIRNVVITVPAYFTVPQRRATEDAAKIAGLRVLKLINEPTAAALAYSQIKDINNRTVLVYDLGGGTFDVSLIKFQDGTGDVIKISGDPALGGRDFDDNLVKYCIDYIRDKYKYCVSTQKPNSKRHDTRRLRNACEDAKKHLSTRRTTEIDLNHFAETDLKIEISREKFEELNWKLFEKTIKIVEETIRDAKITKDDIHDVILVGGSTRIVKIEEMLKDFFEKPLNKNLNREEAVALGAAYQAALLSNDESQIFKGLKLVDIVPRSLGIQVNRIDGKDMSVVIERSSKIPAKNSRLYRTIRDYQPDIDIFIFEGDNDLTTDNTPLGKLTIEGITSKKRGKVEVEVNFLVDESGVLNISAEETSKGLREELRISLLSGRLTDQEIEERRILSERNLLQKVSSFERPAEELHFNDEKIKGRNVVQGYSVLGPGVTELSKELTKELNLKFQKGGSLRNGTN